MIPLLSMDHKGSFSWLVRKNFSEKHYFLPPDTRTYVCVSDGKKC